MRLQLRLPSSRRWASTSSSKPILGIRAEDPLRRWERRVPLTPHAVSALTTRGIPVIVQPSSKRIFPDRAYALAGATLSPDLAPASLVLGIKEIPRDALSPETTYAFFSHTHKGQSYNLPLLRTMLDTPRARFVDWELLTKEEGGERTAAFGFLAGFSGMVDGLAGLGVKVLASTGVALPFLGVPRPFGVKGGVEELRHTVRRVGEEVREEGTGGFGPVVLVVAGRGRVGMGARSVLDNLGVRWVGAQELKGIAEGVDTDLGRIYACHLELGDYLTNADGSPFDREVYRKHPERFISEFDTKIAPYTTMLLNGAFWQPGSPKMLTTEQLANIQKTVPANRFLSIVDVSCDFGGGLEFITGPTTIDDPVFQLDASTGKVHRDPSQPRTTQISSIEILPSQLPLDSSQHFSDAIAPYVDSLLADPRSIGDDALARGLRRATLVEDGKLAERHEHLYEVIKSVETGAAKVERRRKVVILGSGLVAGPAVKVITSRPDLDLIIASNSLESAEALAAPHKHASAVLLDAGDEATLKRLVEDADVVLSLLPAPLHVGVAELCIASGTSLVTASYVSPEMEKLGDRAKAAGIVLLNELGLDPGIDHCSAMRLIKEARDTGNKITSFVSFCGGLPSPEQSNDGPLGYKFSWSPRGVLSAALNPASFRLSSTPITLSGSTLLANHFPSLPLIKGLALEGVANRDSVKYLAEYGLPKDLGTILRGTLRYPGFCRIVDGWKKMGLLGGEKFVQGVGKWEEVVDAVLGCEAAERREKVERLLGGDEVLVKDVLGALEELSLIPRTTSTGPSPTLPPFPKTPQAPIDLLSTLLASQLKYADGERDAVILHHELGTVAEETGENELFTSTLVQYGAPGGDSAMATTVGMPIALGALLILDGLITSRGLVSPSSPEVWEPLLVSLESRGVKMVERRKKGTRGVLGTLERDVDAWKVAGKM